MRITTVTSQKLLLSKSVSDQSQHVQYSVHTHTVNHIVMLLTCQSAVEGDYRHDNSICKESTATVG